MVARPIIEIDGDGTVLAVSQYGEGLDRMQGVEFRSGILCPAFVNVHCHTELSHLLGLIPRQCGNSGFASRIASLRGADPTLRSQAAEKAMDGMYLSGTSLVGDISNDAIDPVAERPECHTFLEVFGLRQSNLQVQRSRLNSSSSLTVHSMYAVSEEDLKHVAYTGDAPLSIHFMESDEETELFHGRGPMAEWFVRSGFEAPFLSRYSSPAERLVRCVPRDRDVILVHSLCATERDIDTVMGHFTGRVSWVLCPRSNIYISGTSPASSAVASVKGLDLCLGTDSLASNPTLELLEEAKCLEGCMSTLQLLGSLTGNGARALGRDREFGYIMPGRKPGIVCISGIEEGRIGRNASVERIV